MHCLTSFIHVLKVLFIEQSNHGRKLPAHEYLLKSRIGSAIPWFSFQKLLVHRLDRVGLCQAQSIRSSGIYKHVYPQEDVTPFMNTLNKDRYLPYTHRSSHPHPHPHPLVNVF